MAGPAEPLRQFLNMCRADFTATTNNACASFKPAHGMVGILIRPKIGTRRQSINRTAHFQGIDLGKTIGEAAKTADPLRQV